MNLNHVHVDARGSIDSLTGLKKFSEVAFLRTKAGFARGGCIHPNSCENICVIEGKIEYFYRYPRENLIRSYIMDAGKSFTIPPNTPHYFISETDSLIIEWGPDPSEKKDKFEEFRKLVVEHNSHI